MEIITRVKSFLRLKNEIENLSDAALKPLMKKAMINNPWFTESNIELAFEGIIALLTEDHLLKWLANYKFSSNTPGKIGVIMAGNIPMVGFHDMLCVLLSNNILNAKLSSQDNILIPFLAEKLTAIEPEWQEKIQFVDKLKGVDAVIATGSDNSARYFEYYFKNIPALIRKNRTSVAVISGNETKKELRDLGKDIYQYFGLGCRNVSKLFLPKNYDITLLLDEWNDWSHFMENHKFMNNHTYYRAIYSIEKIKYLDNGFSIFTQNKDLVSPTSVIYYNFYENESEVLRYLSEFRDKIQCVVSQKPLGEIKTVPFGQTQKPQVWDYSDNVDTMNFLLDL